MFGSKRNTYPPSSPTTSTHTGSTAVASHHHGPRSHPKPLLRTILFALRVLILLSSLYILGVFIYLIVDRTRNDLPITGNRQGSETLAILILAGISTIWSFLSLIMTCCGHQKSGIVLLSIDVIHIGAFIGVAVLLKHEGYEKCNSLPGVVSRVKRDCNLQKAAFAFAIVLAGLYFFATVLSALTVVVFRRSRAFGPSPENGYSEKYNAVPRGKRKIGTERGYIAPTLATTTGPRHSALTDDTAYSGNMVVPPQQAPVAHLAPAGLPPLAPGSAAPVGYEPYRKPAVGYLGGGSAAEFDDGSSFGRASHDIRDGRF